MQERENALHNWLKPWVGGEYQIKPLTGDASFRRYFRIEYANFKGIIMDAPPEREKINSFLAIAELLNRHGLRSPRIFRADETLGFIVLEDFGDQLLLAHLQADTVDEWYAVAIDNVLRLQQCAVGNLPVFNTGFMLQELSLFNEWFVDAYLKLKLDESEQHLLANTFDWLVEQLSAQPQTMIHRDFHSRNLMILSDRPKELGLIDFQDAMKGPCTYDLVSLLKDCYIQWPRERVHEWVKCFYEQSTLTEEMSLKEFQRAFDLCGLQRHLKVLGVFSRLYLRDNKPGYLKDLPLTLHYVLDCLESYEELKPFYQFIQRRIHLP
ncbi:aminoglycoside phosphotransferase family protein [Legionella sp. 16cNR16C]|uniref:aminoglycoside phosphotransferase family protein n=1 Tax=Legionella sp. 16cNR16C TaxID=2905656 RepID=UPI001E5D0900|nr:phosphotransferase [Legionella sp. 16cNR16C]MCE3045552.1 phosphotransferase [Legionella sp. 16cNR16C]